MLRLPQGYARRRYLILFYSLLFTIALTPFFKGLGWPGRLLTLLLGVNLYMAIITIDERIRRHLLFSILTVGVLLWIGSFFFDHRVLSIVAQTAWVGIAIAVLVHCVRFFLSKGNVDSEHIYAALSAYLLAGLFFGVLYWLLDQVIPGSFSLAGTQSSGDLVLSSTVYFSFVTLATLGYGDIVPIGDLSRGIAVLEAVGGQLFITVMVARLVSMHVSSRLQGGSS